MCPNQTHIFMTSESQPDLSNRRAVYWTSRQVLIRSAVLAVAGVCLLVLAIQRPWTGHQDRPVAPLDVDAAATAVVLRNQQVDAALRKAVDDAIGRHAPLIQKAAFDS